MFSLYLHVHRDIVLVVNMLEAGEAWPLASIGGYPGMSEGSSVVGSNGASGQFDFSFRPFTQPFDNIFKEVICKPYSVLSSLPNTHICRWKYPSSLTS